MINFTTIPTPADSTNGKIFFGLIDYGLFGSMLLVSTLIGIYFGFCGKKQNTVTEYVLGGKSLRVVPVAMSLVSSLISGITVLAVPTDVYTYGASYSLIAASILLVGLTMHFVFLPVYYKLQVTSIYEYLNLRFGKSVRTMGSIMYTVTIIVYMPIVVYVPALAFSQVSGANIHLVTAIVCVICIFYTTLGGLKAVVWTDALQFVIMLGAIFAVLYLGIIRAGGFEEIFRIANEGGRTEIFDFDSDPTNRTSFWSVFIGMYFTWVAAMAAGPGAIQKFMSLPSLPDITKTLIFFTINASGVKLLTSFIGLVLYAEYRDCDPLTAGIIDRPDQLLAHYVMGIAGHIPGLPGIFVAGVFCASLSTMSAILNTLACTIYEDLIGPHMPKGTTEKRASDIMKMVVVIMGALSTSLVFIVERMGTLMPLSISLNSLVHGPMFGLFSLGMLAPSANTKGVLWGASCGIISMSTIIFGAQYHKANGALGAVPLPISTEGCNFTVADTFRLPADGYEPPYIFRISFYYHTVIGFVITWFVGLIASRVTGGSQQKVDRDLLSPVVHWMLPKREHRRRRLRLKGSRRYIFAGYTKKATKLHTSSGSLSTITLKLGICSEQVNRRFPAEGDRDQLSPMVHWMLPKREYRYNTVAQTSSVAQEGSFHQKR